MARPKKSSGFNPEQTNSQNRVYGSKVKIKTDLFKLEVAECNMNKSWNDVPNLESVEHVHFFHTYDSDGRKMTKTNTVAGHFHAIEVEDQGNDKPAKIISVSPPMRELRRRIKGKFTKVFEPIDSALEDEHTHEITYRRTEIVDARQVSPNAVSIEAQEANKTAPIAGVQIG